MCVVENCVLSSGDQHNSYNHFTVTRTDRKTADTTKTSENDHKNFLCCLLCLSSQVNHVKIKVVASKHSIHKHEKHNETKNKMQECVILFSLLRKRLQKS